MKATRKTAVLSLLFAILAAIAVMLYPSVQRYRNLQLQRDTVYGYKSMTAETDSAEFEQMRKSAVDYNIKLRELAHPLVQYDRLGDYSTLLNPYGDGMMCYLSIDKIHVQLPVYHGTDEKVLNNACGHLEGTSLPVGGIGSHCVISAHRSLQASTLFTDLNKLTVGDIFTLTVFNDVLTYQVDQIKIVLPTETSDLKIDENCDFCTLMTCTPYGINSHRLLVRGRRISNISESTRQNRITADAHMIDRSTAASIGAMPFLLVLIIYILFKPTVRKFEIDGD